MKRFLLSALMTRILAATLQAQSPEPPVDPFSGAPPLSVGQQVVAKANASVRATGDRIEALNDGLEPKAAGAADVPYYSFSPRTGTFEWVEYGFAGPVALRGCEVFWKTGPDFQKPAKPKQTLELPLWWKVLYQNKAGDWLPVDGQPGAVAAVQWNVCLFKPVMARGLRLIVQQPSQSLAGIVEWKVIPHQGSVPPENPPNELRLDDLIPIRAEVSFGGYRVNRFFANSVQQGGQILLDGQPCAHYLLTHAPSSVSFAVPGGYSRFSAIALAPTPHADPTWTYEVVVDGKSVYRSEQLRTYPDYRLPIEVPLPVGCRMLTLVTGDAGSGTADHSIWAEPKFLRSPARPATGSGPAAARTKTPVPKPVGTPGISPAQPFEIKLESAPDRFLVARRDKVLEVNAKRGGVFRIVPGLKDPKLVSLELVGARGFYVRHRDSYLFLHERPKNDGNFENDASFTLVKLGADQVRFEAKNWSGGYIMIREDGSPIVSKDATTENSIFRLVPK